MSNFTLAPMVALLLLLELIVRAGLSPDFEQWFIVLVVQ